MAADPEAAPVDDSPRVKAALWFAAHGFGVFSCWSAKADGTCRCAKGRACSSPGKHPITENGFKDATTDQKRIRTMLSAASDPNYGLVPPEGVFVLDVDGDDWRERLATLEGRHGPLPATLRTETRNGLHIFLRWPDAHPRPLHRVFGWVTRWGSGSPKHLGYVIGPRSIHPSGFEYAPAGAVFEVATLPEAWALAALSDADTDGTIKIGGGDDPSTVSVGSRHDFLRDRARFYAGSIRDPDALFAAVWALNEKLPVPKDRESVQRAIGEALTKYPADPVEVDEETGETRVVRAPGMDESRGIASPLAAGRFPDPPDRLAFEGLVGEVVAELAAGTDASEVGMLGSVLAFMGILYPATGHFGRHQSTSLFVGLVGPSTEGRKGTAMERAEMALGQALGTNVIVNSMLDGINSGEGLVTALETQQDRFRSDPTAGIMYEEEFATLLAAQSRDNSTLDPRMRTAWDGKPLSNRKQSGKQSVQQPYWLSTLVSITPKELRERAPAGAFTSGSFNRWLWLPVIRRDIEVMDTPPDIPYKLRSRLSESYHAAQQDRPFLKHTSAAQRLLADYSTHLLKVCVGTERDLSARLVPIALRVGLIHAMVEGQREVTRDHVARGIALAEYARSGIAWIFGMTVGDPIAQLILRLAMDDEDGVVTKQQITQDVTRDPIKRQAAIDKLTDSGLMEVVKVKTHGRPRQEVRLLPSKGTFQPFSHLCASQPDPQRSVSETRTTPESAETRITQETHESAGKAQKVSAWLRPCRDYTAHQDDHQQTSEGWVCRSCDEHAS